MARYEDTVRWTGRLEMELGKDYRVIEAGYCGRTTVFDDPLVSHCNGFSFLLLLNYHFSKDNTLLYSLHFSVLPSKHKGTG